MENKIKEKILQLLKDKDAVVIVKKKLMEPGTIGEAGEKQGERGYSYQAIIKRPISRDVYILIDDVKNVERELRNEEII